MEVENREAAQSIAKFKEFARVVMAHHFGRRPKRVEHKAEGLSNFVFLASHESEHYIVRISDDPAAINSYIKEQWCQLAAHKLDVPTAEILEVGNSIIPHPYMIVRNVVGRSAGTHPNRLDIIRQMGEIALRVNTIPTQGYGATFDWSNNLLSLNSSWRDYLDKEYGYKERIEFLEGRKMIDRRQGLKLADLLSEARRLKSGPRLCHGDIRLKNVIVTEEGKIAALIDWEKASSNIAPYWELSVALHDLGIDEMQAFTDGYGLTRAKLAKVSPLVKAFNILNYVPEVQRAVESKDKQALESVRARMNGLFDLYSL